MKEYCLHIYTPLRRERKLSCGMRRVLTLTLFILNITISVAQITIGGSVFGGGEVGKVNGDANVVVNDGTIGSLVAKDRGVSGRSFTINGGDIYGGGNKGDLDGKTTVTLRGGNIYGGVFGGARMADVGKSTLVNVDGANQLHDITANFVFGGNDISGTIGSKLGDADEVRIENPEVTTVDKTFQTFIHTTAETGDHHIFIGQMFGGGNGAYTYEPIKNDEDVITGYNIFKVSHFSDDHTPFATSDTELPKPELGKTYLQINGGTYGYAYAGGNAATVTSRAVISINNTSEITTETDALDVKSYTKFEDLTTADLNNPVDLRLLSMGINLATFTNDRQFIHVFGGNNQADMAIRPLWNLAKGNIHNLYSGGNEGRMTAPTGILLEIMADSKIVVDNVYGGCRKADVRPLTAGGEDVDPNQLTLPGYHFPKGYSAHLLVRGGTITNVYGGNDISGNVYGGNAVGVYTSISGDLYGGGNGSYSYTDNPELKNDLIWGDFYYNPDEVLANDGITATSEKLKSVEALNVLRPNAEQISMRIYSSDPEHPTVIGKSVYIGGNSAAMSSKKENPTAELKIGSNVIADRVFLGNNGENMVDATENGVLARYAGNVYAADKTEHDFSTLTLTDAEVFAKYMEGCAMKLIPSIVFDDVNNGDPDTYDDYTAYFGDFYCGGNVGSVITDGCTNLNFKHKIYIFDKLVGGCNNANVPASAYNAVFKGGVLNTSGAVDAGPIADKLVINLEGPHILPKRWQIERDANYDPILDANGDVQYVYNGTSRMLEWNTVDVRTGKAVPAPTTLPSGGVSTEDDINRRLEGGNVYGGCYNSGHIEGNVVININSSINERMEIFDITEVLTTGEAKVDGDGNYKILQRNSGVLVDEQGMDVFGEGLNVFGGGYGEESEVWGSATVNLNKGYAFQIFGGGEHGPIGKTDNGTLTYDERYSTYVNLNGTVTGKPRSSNPTEDDKNLAASEFLYAGSFEAPIAGNTNVYLGNGQIYNSFGGSCNADIYGHTETYVGLNANGVAGFPYVREHIYGGNDLGGEIKGSGDFTERVREDVAGIRDSIYGDIVNEKKRVVQASAYIEYQQGHIENIFGGSYGAYDYSDRVFEDYTYDNGLCKPGFTKPRLNNAFVNFRPVITSNQYNAVAQVYGACQGISEEVGMDSMQVHSYVLIDIPQEISTFEDMAVFGSGAYGGLGMGVSPAVANANPEAVSAVIDLFRGEIGNVYGASFNEGFTRRTVVNVPGNSTINAKALFAGGYGKDNTRPCDAYEAIINYRSPQAQVRGGSIYGGNNNARRTFYGQVNIYTTAYSDISKNRQVTVFGAGQGSDTWSQYTEVNLEKGSLIYEVYGGGRAGKVLNVESVAKWKTTDPTVHTDMPPGYTDNGLENVLAKAVKLDGKKYNANVHIYNGANVGEYSYGGGLGADAVVSGTAYIDLLGGTVGKDIYASGTSGDVKDLFAAKNFIATSNAYIEGRTVRNVYGSGWRGGTGAHDPSTTSTAEDIMGETHVVIGKIDGTSYIDGIPAIKRSVYGGGEGGTVYGTANVTINNGYIGFNYQGTDPNTFNASDYHEQLDDAAAGDNLLDESGNVFGGGYVANGSVDFSNVAMYGGVVRGSIYGGGEIGSIGRGTVGDGKPDGIMTNDKAKIYKGGSTHVALYKGHVMRNVFGGGRGYDNWGGEGYMTDAEKATMDLSSKGYVFGSTDVNVYGGEVGTVEGTSKGYGNVFGGGDVGYVYSASGMKSGTKNDNVDNGYYYRHTTGTNSGSFILEGKEKILTEDCRVVVEPWCLITGDATYEYDGKQYTTGDYLPAAYLNTFKNKNDDSRWANLDLDGIIIRNAIFAGGNVSTGSDQVYANASTVYGNATATIFDLYNRDLITVGTEHIGGLYGDGNLTFVDGYRELNISNFGTDYYGMSDNITLDEYYNLSDRERAYFELKYKCVTPINEVTINGKTYSYAANASISEEEYETVWVGTAYQSCWVEAGFCSIYAGRLLNTIQRADFVGVFGSRMVLQGAQDRVPETVDYTNYTINRVGEVSLNQVVSPAGDTGDAASHGNYFGIYNIVNYMGALTSDVNFNDVRITGNDAKTYEPNWDGQTYYQWKQAHFNERKRNNGKSPNKVALASGVFLELTTERSTPTQKDWGLITGVVELDLINVMTGLGGGYVYAKNEHGTRSETGLTQTILSPYNTGACTNKSYSYDTTLKQFETSGNFIHSAKQIVDDCYPTAGKYQGEDAAPAHYWYIKGSIYVYDQYISAYTGSANPYRETVNIPLTITAASHGKISIEHVQPNLYAYYKTVSGESKTKLEPNETMLVNNITYHINDTISYWDWMQLSDADQMKFVKETYTTVAECKIGDVTYPKGYTMLKEEYDDFLANNDSVYHVSRETNVHITEVFRSSNNMSHMKGYILSFDMNNPNIWDNYYTHESGINKINNKTYEGLSTSEKDTYVESPTYTPKQSGVYGQRNYTADDIIPGSIHRTYETLGVNKPTQDQATVERAYVAIQEINQGSIHLYPGVAVAKGNYDDATWTAISSKLKEAYVCTNTMELGLGKFIYQGELMPIDSINKIKTDYADKFTELEVESYFDDAWYCTSSGKYGGNYYDVGHNYRALDAWCALSAEDRQNFTFTYDAFDVLVDSLYQDAIGYYDGEDGVARLYGEKQSIDYTALYTGTEDLTFTNETGTNFRYTTNEELTREEYEAIPNEQYHFSPVLVETPGTYYVVKVGFARGDIYYSVGNTVSREFYNSLDESQKLNVQAIPFTDAQAGSGKTYYFCREFYQVNEHGEGQSFSDINGNNYANGDNVALGTVIDADNYAKLPNFQTNFTIQGVAPVETSTLYVSRESDIFDLSKGRIITVIMKYEYEESDETNKHIEQITERHIVNIHINFKSGVPQIGDLSEPSIVLPGTTVGLKVPSVTPGAFEILGGGWEIFSNQKDAEKHTNGQPYANNSTPMYWYQDGYWVSYYTKTYLGKTYSNAVQFAVANYHDIDAVMSDTENHMFIDNKEVKRDPKIYIDGRATTDANKSKLDLLKDLFDLTQHQAEFDIEGNPIPISSGTLAGHNGVDAEQIGNARNLEFFLKGNVAPKEYLNDWTPIANGSGECFEGTLHGDGYTVSDLTNSLFGHLCGQVYNLGVTGTFTSAGIADTGDGYIENCWTKSTATAMDEGICPVLGTPTRDNPSNPYQVVNCYYPVTNVYTPTAELTTKMNTTGTPRAMSEKAFYNGEVTYNLNGFYLNKRFYDHNLTSGTAYRYFPTDGGVMATEPATAYYEDSYAYYPLGSATSEYGYVENRFADGDFIYAGGSIPSSTDVRLYEDLEKGTQYYPIWPDDYIFFGQTLTYGHVAARPHQDLPSHINKEGGRLATTSASINRVYRAPAYFQSKEMSTAYYNPYAVFAAESADKTHEAYPHMTAIDFTGGNGDVTGSNSDYKQGLQTNGLFFPPMLDNDGLSLFRNVDLTKNLLVYTPSNADGATAAETKTYNAVTAALIDPAYSEGQPETYRTVAVQETGAIYGHVVVKTGTDYTAKTDHLLVDKQEFNAPMAYTFASGKRMWYQRTPDLFATYDKGWEGISIPFSAELVTTQTKGELTHFYTGSTTGHEYWLREFNGNLQQAKDDEDQAISGLYTAEFNLPEAGANEKIYNNTFLWDYYYQYSGDDRLDRNNDTYQQGYYATSHTYSDYPYSDVGTPYLIGFPGPTFYEFDLKGDFKAHNTKQDIAQLSKQTVTFASAPAITITVSDDELLSKAVTKTVTTEGIKGDYTFRPNYMSKPVATGSYQLNGDGSAYEEQTTEVTPVPFRPYFTSVASAGAPRFIAFNSMSSTFGGDEENQSADTVGSLNIFAKKGRIIVESSLPSTANVHIFSVAGTLLRTFVINPGEKIQTPVDHSGIYLVSSSNGQNEKLSVKK